MNSLFFLNSGLLWGLALASIPLIIHLLFRRRFRQVEWAPMRYLKLTIQRNRRRIQLEQLLLLLLRTALIVILVCMLSRPILNAAGIGRWLAGDTRTSHILLLDDSLSMGLSSSGRTAFQHAVELAAQAVEDIGRGDRFTLVLSSRPEAPLLREVELADPNEALNVLRALQPTETLTSWAATLSVVDKLVQSSTFPTRTVTIITDLRRVGWEDEVAAPANWEGERVQVRIIDVGGNAARQISLDRLVQADRLALVGTPIRWEATVRNASESLMENLEATWLIDGQPNQFGLPSLAPGETAIVPLTAVFQEPGLHHVSLRLPPDDLLGDNQRWDVVSVKENLRLLLVDGEPSAEMFQGETDFLGLALSLAIGDSRAFQVETMTETEWQAAAKSAPDLIVFANVAAVDAAQRDLLRKLVEAGTGLMIFPGDQVDPDNYNRQLFEDGSGLLPVKLEAPQDETVTGLLLEENSQSAVDALRQLSASVLQRIKINKRYQVRLPEQQTADVRILARWNDASASPALCEKVIGRGRVLFWTITADKNWSDWPTEPSYVLAVRETAKAIARTDSGVNELTAGEALRCPVSGDRQITSPTLELPGGDEPKALTIEAGHSSADKLSPQENAADSTQYLVWTGTHKAGLYRLNWQESPGGSASNVFAVNPEVRESDLARIPADELKNRWKGVVPAIITALTTIGTNVGVRGQEVWRSMAFCLLGMMGFEACFATWVGRQR
ncbi:MAG: BatA domain-containing protein [Fuerstia sp.]|nr:BatA domain-containing protein [Fuerstiella sp.]